MQFLTEESLPSNVSFQVQDAFQDVLADVCEKFDVVHIRAFVLVVTDNQPEPGGYLQWDEKDSAALRAHAPKPESGLDIENMA
ncbi:MAG: hypothetical protein Q9222_005810 [Ikaeria aurantiellina]